MHPALSHDSRTLSIPKQTPTCQQSHIITTVQAIQILLQKGRAWWHFMGTKHRCVSWGWVHRHDKADPNGSIFSKMIHTSFLGRPQSQGVAAPNPSCVIWINWIYPCIMGFQGDQFDKSFSQLSLHHGLPLDSTLGDPKNWTVRLLLRLGASLQSGFDGCCMWPDLVESGCSAPMRICRNISSRVRKGAESLSLEYTSQRSLPRRVMSKNCYDDVGRSLLSRATTKSLPLSYGRTHPPGRLCEASGTRPTNVMPRQRWRSVGSIFPPCWEMAGRHRAQSWQSPGTPPRRSSHSTFQRRNLGEWSGKTHHVSPLLAILDALQKSRVELSHQNGKTLSSTN